MFRLLLATLACGLVASQDFKGLRGASPRRQQAETPAEETGGLTAAEQTQLNREFRSAIHSGDKTTAAAKLAEGAQIDDVTLSGPMWTPLADATIAHNEEMALWLLANGADPDFEDRRGRTPLYHAVHYKLYDVVEEMLKTATLFTAHDGDGVDLLTRAIWQEDVEMVQMLVDAGVTSDRATNAASHAIWEIMQIFGFTTEAPVPDVPAEVPVAVTEAPVAVTEAPAAVTEAPAVATEAPAVATEAPAAVTEAPAAAAVTEAPAAAKKTPQDFLP